jgi:hypothetical protein
MKSYSVALEMAIGNKQHGFAVSALRSHASLPSFPPSLTHFDTHRDPDSVCNPVADLVDSFARAQAHAQKFGDDEHQLQRDELFRQIQCATQQLQDITPNLHGINSLHVSPVVSDHVTLDFRGTELVNTAGPEAFIDPFAEPITAFDGNSASIEINNLEDDSGHSTATRTPESIRRAGMFSPYGLKVMVVQTGAALALFALVCLTVYPDATIDVFSNATAAELYSRVPLAQRHRVFLHRADPRNLTLTAVQLALQDHDRSCRHIDFLYVEDLDPAYSHLNYERLRQKITEFNPDLLYTFRNRFEDRTLGSRLNDSIRYLIEQPAALQCIKMVPTVRQGSKDKAVVDQDSVQIDWIENVLELFDDYITDKYNVPVCVGLFLYEDLAEIAFNNLDASEVSVGDTSAAESCASTLVTTGEPPSGNTSTSTRPKANKRPFNDVLHRPTKSRRTTWTGLSRQWSSVPVPW